VRHAILGCGRVGPNHVDGFRHCAGSEIAWICDRDPRILEAFAAAHGVEKATCDAQEVLQDPEVDSVSIAVDHAQHADLSRRALLAGKHVLVEKPLALSLEDGERVVRLARERGAVLAVVSQHRYDPLILEIRRLIESGALGRVVALSANVLCGREPGYYRESYWRGKRAGEGGSVLINQAYHCIDLMVWLGGPVAGVEAALATLKLADVIETEDTACALLRFANGALGSVAATAATRTFWETRMTVVGTEGHVSFDINHPNRLHGSCLPDDAERELRAVLDLSGAEEPPPGMDYYGISHRRQIAEFVQAVAGGGRVAVDGEQGLRTLAVILDLYRAGFGEGTGLAAAAGAGR